VFYCCKKLNIDWKTLPYTLLGDDIVICNKDVAELYLKCIRSLGVEVSDMKTHVSPHFYEFAKRYNYKGMEISPFPISALKESLSRSYLMVNLLLELESKGFIAQEGIPIAVSSAYGILKQLPSKFRGKMYDKSYSTELMMKIIKGVLTAEEGCKALLRYWEFPTAVDRAIDSYDGVLQSLAVEAFADSNPENDKFKKASKIPLGGLAEQLVCHFTGFSSEEDQNLGFMLIYALPHLGAYGLIEEMFINMKKEARRIDTTGGGDWPLLLKTMALPLDDQIFVQRTSHLIARSSAVMATKVKERFEMIQSFYT